MQLSPLVMRLYALTNDRLLSYSIDILGTKNTSSFPDKHLKTKVKQRGSTHEWLLSCRRSYLGAHAITIRRPGSSTVWLLPWWSTSLEGRWNVTWTCRPARLFPMTKRAARLARWRPVLPVPPELGTH